MLMESSFRSSVETNVTKLSEYEDPSAPYDLVSLAETYHLIHKFRKHSQLSFLEAVPITDAMNLDESQTPKLQVSCPDKSVMRKVSEKSLTYLVYSRRKRSVRPVCTTEQNPPKNKKHDDSLCDSIASVHNPGGSTKRKNRFNNCLVYSRKKMSMTIEHNPPENKKQDDSLHDRKHRFNNCLVYSRKKWRGKSKCSTTRETIIRCDELDDAFVSGHDCGETKGRRKRLDNCLVYSRKKGRVKSDSCSFSTHVYGGIKISGDQAGSSAYSQRGEIVKADGAFTCHQHVYSQSNQLVKSNGRFTESRVWETKRNGNRSDVLLMYSRRNQRVESIGVRVNGFLVYSRKKRKVNSRGSVNGYDPRETKKTGDQLSIVSYHALSVSEKYVNSGQKSSSELASGSSKATDCNYSDASATDTESSSSPFRHCKHCDKPGTVEKMLICDECEQAYHTSCCGVRIEEVADIDDWLCPSCLKRKSSNTKIKRRVLPERKWRVTERFLIGIRIGKEFQADVRDWSGPTMSDTSFVGVPFEIDESEYMHARKKSKNGKKQRHDVNWLQCREEGSNGDICGKWRRAPRSEVQTEDWECFCCVFWDPSHADCAVPQEVETSEIMKQLKYIEMVCCLSTHNFVSDI
ncbi:unnamed protein product [Cochlearia groenlandica]